jgi:hypothetical protein
MWQKPPLVKNFMTAWITQIRERRAAHSVGRMGWISPAGVIEAFAYGGQVYDKNGPRLHQPTGVDAEYSPRGKLDEWRKGASAYVGKGCIEMEVLIATALLHSNDIHGSRWRRRVRSPSQSGRARRHRWKLHAAWGPKTVISSATPTPHVSACRLNNLPVYHDEFVGPVASRRA